eukprot:1071405-Pyramimonas_sp.AAC.1
MRPDVGHQFLHADVADASPVHGRCIAAVSATRRDPPTPSTRTPSRRPLVKKNAFSFGSKSWEPCPPSFIPSLLSTMASMS